ncbi:nucleotide exchange factor GrpE [Pseudoclavibacter sp. 13-3]|uniref:nucleotide exchange factor GrpE n=1 Tax=Pseudoclavibacter sp. 13-3 TaxID=2901228 RepID=UPI001E2FCC72|nr:nucleotide exchange factor GrpE [Pseudoclavibacter sp. 13-3]MCD7101411.1 nucleotide exchange factor GrpE [Pseudoclavibacter sp. 13-3]
MADNNAAGTPNESGLPDDGSQPTSQQPEAQPSGQQAEGAQGADAASAAPGRPGEQGQTDAGVSADDGAGDADGEASREDKLLDELQRLAAEYKNYRQRTEAQQIRDRERAVGDAAKRLFPIFDDLDRAEKAGDLAEGTAFATIASKLRAVGEGLGIERFGAKGEPFDPNQHEAVLQQPSPDVDALVIGEVVEPGYKLGDTLLRAAKVVVLAPAE